MPTATAPTQHQINGADAASQIGASNPYVYLGAQALGMLGGYASSANEGRMNRQAMDRSNWYTDKWNQEQMDFQAQMSNNAHLREVRDLKRAGLNPLLSATGGAGASTPSGASGQGQAANQPSPGENIASSVSDMVHTKLQMEKQDQELKNMKSSNQSIQKSIQQTDASIKNTNADTQKKAIESQVLKKEIPKADLTNDVYDLFRPAIEKAKKIIQSPKGFKAPQNKVNTGVPWF